MSYRSDVRIIVSKKGYKHLEQYVNDYLKKKGCNIDEYNLLNDCTLKEHSDKGSYIGWNCIKWYDQSNYPEIDSIMEGLTDLKEKGYSFRYAKIGESYDDYEEEYYTNENDLEEDLEFPSLCREFEDDCVIDYMRNKDNIEI